MYINNNYISIIKYIYYLGNRYVCMNMLEAVLPMMYPLFLA